MNLYGAEQGWAQDDLYIDCRNTPLTMGELYEVAKKRLLGLTSNANGRMPLMTVGMLTEDLERTLKV